MRGGLSRWVFRGRRVVHGTALGSERRRDMLPFSHSDSAESSLYEIFGQPARDRRVQRAEGLRREGTSRHPRAETEARFGAGSPLELPPVPVRGRLVGEGCPAAWWSRWL